MTATSWWPRTMPQRPDIRKRVNETERKRRETAPRGPTGPAAGPRRAGEARTFAACTEWLRDPVLATFPRAGGCPRAGLLLMAPRLGGPLPKALLEGVH